MKPSPVTTYHPRVEISVRNFINVMCSGGNKIKILANKCLDIDSSLRKYFSGTGKSILINCYKFQSLLIYKINILTHSSFFGLRYKLVHLLLKGTHAQVL